MQLCRPSLGVQLALVPRDEHDGGRIDGRFGDGHLCQLIKVTWCHVKCMLLAGGVEDLQRWVIVVSGFRIRQPSRCREKGLFLATAVFLINACLLSVARVFPDRPVFPGCTGVAFLVTHSARFPPPPASYHHGRFQPSHQCRPCRLRRLIRVLMVVIMFSTTHRLSPNAGQCRQLAGHRRNVTLAGDKAGVVSG